MPGSLSVRKKNARKQQDKSLTPVEKQVQKLFGVNPKLVRNRGVAPVALNPTTNRAEWALPQFVYDMASDFVTPGLAAAGQPIGDPEAAASRFALNFTGTGGVASRMGRGAVGEGRAVLGMSGAPKQLALPAPSPKPPSYAVKPRGGQWWSDKNIGAMRQSDLGVKLTKLPDTDTWAVRDDGGRVKLFGNEDEARAHVQTLVSGANPNRSPENAARQISDDVLRLAPDAEGPLSQLQSWFNKAAPKYIKNEFGTADDPMRALAESGSLHVGLNPDQWSEAAKQVLRQETIGDVIGLNELRVPQGALPGAGSDYRANVLLNMPWLQKAPVTDKLYGIADRYTLHDTMGMGHLLDEMKNALDPRSGLPPELMLRPESLGRMSLPAAAERVSLINQFRAKEMERAALSNLDSPAVQTFKEYAENNPLGLRWTELKAAQVDRARLNDLQKRMAAIKHPAAYDVASLTSPSGDPVYYVAKGSGQNRQYLEPFSTEAEARARLDDIRKDYESSDYASMLDEYEKSQPQAIRSQLEEALKYEGDTMGHCVGGYCDDVMEGRSRIFSLRDAKGEPHVTIETSPRRSDYIDRIDEVPELADAWNTARYGYNQPDPNLPFDMWLAKHQPELYQKHAALFGPQPDDIVQIKGKQNRAPKDDYLPFVQDFVKSQQWGNVGDLGNTGLVKLPDGRYITAQQAEEALSGLGGDIGTLDARYLDRLGEDAWKKIAPNFEGFAIGGRVDADRCFCRHPMSVKR